MEGPAGIKAALEIRQLCGNFLRLPLVPVNEATYIKIRNSIEQIDKKSI